MLGGTQVAVYTSSHRITGSLNPGAPGLFSYLNRPTESYIELLDVSMKPLHQYAGEPEQSSSIWLIKKEIAAILVGSRKDLGSSSSVRAGYTRPFPHYVRLIVGGYEVRGVLHSGARLNFGAVMFEGGNTFTPLFEANLVALLFPKVRAAAAAMLFNRSMVQALSLLPREDMPTGPDAFN